MVILIYKYFQLKFSKNFNKLYLNTITIKSDNELMYEYKITFKYNSCKSISLN